MYAEITELQDDLFVIELSSRGNVIGEPPFTIAELKALKEALSEWEEDGGF